MTVRSLTVIYSKISGYLNTLMLVIRNINYLFLLIFCMHVYVCVWLIVKDVLSLLVCYGYVKSIWIRY